MAELQEEREGEEWCKTTGHDEHWVHGLSACHGAGLYWLVAASLKSRSTGPKMAAMGSMAGRARGGGGHGDNTPWLWAHNHSLV
jgi:hypothetical protein